MSLACVLSLLLFTAVAADAPRYAGDGKVHGCFSRMPECCEEVCAASGTSDLTESKCFVESRKQCASGEEFREEKNNYH
jgi:hypothetical protein